jgi:hypothetical protein
MRPDRDLIGDVSQNLVDHVCLPEFFSGPSPAFGATFRLDSVPRRHPTFS